MSIDKIRNALEGVTPGPWKWFGNANSQQVYLATTHSGRRYVMDFVRWGMRGAQPRFQPERGGMVDAKDLLQFEVGDQSVIGVDAARKDGSVYRYDVRGIDCPDARYIEVCNPAAITELLAAYDALKAENERLSAVLQICETDRKERIEQCGRMAAYWGSFCEEMDVTFDTHDAVAYELRTKIDNAEARAEAAEAECKRMREALEPFAKAAEIKLCGEWRDDERFSQTDVGFHLNFGHLRRAREALTAAPSEVKP